MKLNMGCGFRKLDSYVNVDIEPSCNPDVVMDMEKIPWPFEDDSAEEMVFIHSLEHVGQLKETFLSIVKEIYRVCQNGAMIRINVPNPNHPDFLGDPTHVRPITPQMLVTFNQKVNDDWISRGLPGTPMGKYLGVDFEMVGHEDHGGVWYEIVLKCRKEVKESVVEIKSQVTEKPQREINLCRWGGLGDVCIMLAAACGIHRETGWKIGVYTNLLYKEIVDMCPHVTYLDVYNDKTTSPRDFFDLGSAWFGQHQGHQIDNYLTRIGVDVRDKFKRLDLDFVPSFLGCKSTKKWVVLHPGITDPNRTWPEKHWKSLSEMLINSGYSVRVIGKRNSSDGRSMFDIDVSGVVDCSDGSYTDLLNTFHHSDLLVSADSGPIQLAGATDIAILGIYSVVSGNQRLPFRHGKLGWNAVAVEPKCPYHPCYHHMKQFPSEGLGRYFAEWCPDKLDDHCEPFICMRTISPELVFSKCIDLLEKVQ